MQKASFFSMDLVHEVCSMNDPAEAKAKALQAVRESTARDNNKRKATSALDKCTSVKQIIFTLTNFMLAHPAEDLAVLR